jgi:hypothetical protein
LATATREEYSARATGAATPDLTRIDGGDSCGTGEGVITGDGFSADGLGDDLVDLDGGTTGSGADGLGGVSLGPICGGAGSLGGLDGEVLWGARAGAPLLAAQGGGRLSAVTGDTWCFGDGGRPT